MANQTERFDVVILGGGLAGLSLARHLLLDTERSVLLLERQSALPPERQKVGESTVQLAGYYFSRVLDLEEHLLRRHLMKYNLRFYWPSGRGGDDFFDHYSQAYIREISNVASYQLDRNVFEGELLRCNLESDRFQALLGVEGVEVDLAGGGPDAGGSQDAAHEPSLSAAPAEGDHVVRFRQDGELRTVSARWVVDATGRHKVLAKKLGLKRSNEVSHGAFFWWVDGLVDIERLSDRTPRERRLSRRRSTTGHLPTWLATNHFCGEGYWFWVIPLQGKTSLGLVYDRAVVDPKDVSSVDKACEWVCRHHPLMARDLPHRKVLGQGGFRSYSHDCARTISRDRWALAGEAGRFSDPLYSPGSDLIALHNTLIVDAIQTEGSADLAAKTRLYEQVMRAVYSAYLPSYGGSYDALGDVESMSLKYTWELAVYFAYYVFPFINDLFTDRRFLVSWLRAFSRLGPINEGVHRLLSGYFQWRKEHLELQAEPLDFDFSSHTPLDRARETFYRVGVTVEEAREVLAEQLNSLEEMARFAAARVASVVIGDPRVATDAAFVAGLDPSALAFEPEVWRQRWAEVAGRDGEWRWTLDATVFDEFDVTPKAAAVAAAS